MLQFMAKIQSKSCFHSLLLLIFFMHTCIRCSILAEKAATHNHNGKTRNAVEFYYYSKHLGLTLPFFDRKRCLIKVGTAEDQVIDLSSLARHDGQPRFKTKFNITSVVVDDLKLPPTEMNYAFNPCVPYTFKTDYNEEPLGRSCKDVTVCKYIHDDYGWHFYPLGRNTDTASPSSSKESGSVIASATSSKEYLDSRVDAVFVRSVDRDVTRRALTLPAESDTESDLTPEVALVYSIRLVQAAPPINTTIHLVCNKNLTETGDAVFRITSDIYHKTVSAELHHKCCCPGMCIKQVTEKEAMLILVLCVVSLLAAVICIACGCYCKRKHVQFYSKLPAIIPSIDSRLPPPARYTPSHRPMGGGPTLNGHAHSHIISSISVDGGGGFGAEMRDYEPSSVVTARRKKIPVLTDPTILSKDVDMGQRLGGSFFMDTHLGTYKETTVTVKRLTLSIHDNQLTSRMVDIMKDEVWTLSRQRHKNIVSILGLCLDGRLPFLLTEFVVGDCLKDFLQRNKHRLIWPQRVRMCSQVADGMAFLHSTKPPIIHRDLRCGNIFLSDNDNTVKVADFGLTKLLQPLREQCGSDDCGCQRKTSACPPSIRWTAPELLQRPTSHEGDSSIISTACDVYSFAMVMFEMLGKDPFDDIGSETEVIEIVKNSGRPEVPPMLDVLTQYMDLMKTCWDQRPSFRPAFKQVAVKLKEMVGPARSHHKQVSNQKSNRHSRGLHSSTDLA